MPRSKRSRSKSRSKSRSRSRSRRRYKSPRMRYRTVSSTEIGQMTERNANATVLKRFLFGKIRNAYERDTRSPLPEREKPSRVLSRRMIASVNRIHDNNNAKPYALTQLRWWGRRGELERAINNMGDKHVLLAIARGLL